MKKYIFVVMRFVLILTVTVGTVFLTSCANNDTFVLRNYSTSIKNISSIDIDVIDREVEVKASRDEQVHVEYFESEKEFYNIETNNEKLTMKYTDNKQWTDFIGAKTSSKYRKIIFQIPNNFIDNLIVTTTNENIKIFTLFVKNDMSLNTNGGNIEIEKVGVGRKLNLVAKNGNISGNILGNYNEFAINCEIKKGNCNLPLEKSDGEKLLHVQCNNGDIRLNFVER